MKNTILFFFLLLAAAVSAQSNSFVTDRLRAAEYLRIGTNTSQKVTGFDKVITAPGTHDSLPTSRAVVDFLEANFTPIGYYTAGTGISISDDVITNTAPDQVVGLTGGGITVVTGTYPNFTITSNEVDGSTTNELQNLSLSGQSLSISSGTGVTLPVVGVSAGTGISVSGSGGTFTVTNTGDLSSTNEIQTLSLSGSDLTLSDGGGTVTLPGGADGNGIYSGSGTIPDGTSASWGGGTVLTTWNGDGYNVTEWNAGDYYSLAQSGPDGMVAIAQNSSLGQSLTAEFLTIGYNVSTENVGQTYTSTDANITYNVNGNAALNFIAGNKTFSLDSGGDKFEITDNGDGLGVKYSAEYPNILTNDRSIPDVGTVNLLKQTPVSYTNAAAPNNTIFYSTTDSKLSYKDPAGVVHNLY